MKAEVITIGDEILYGQILDTNTQFISEELTKIGISVVRKSSIGDSEAEIIQILKEASERADVIILTGGLGPTKDDITKTTLAQYFGVGFVRHEPTLDQITDYFTKRGREMIEANTKQADVLANCEVLMNKLGTAPGMWIEHQGKIFISMPGVPYEMKQIMLDHVIEKLRLHFNLPVIVHKMIHTIGIGESFLAEKIKDWENSLPAHIKLAYLPSLGIVKLRLTGKGNDASNLSKEIEDLVVMLNELVGNYIFGYDGDSKIAKVIGDILINSNLTLSTAESCTGGNLAHLITSISGSSAYYKGSVIAYANETKAEVLGIPEEIIEAYGAVSEEVAKLMAENVREKLNTDVGIATTGIAGPNGGTSAKPVGTVWLAFADKNKTVAKKLVFTNSRENNIQLFSVYALNLLRIMLLDLK